MPSSRKWLFCLCLIASLLAPTPARATILELFANGAASKNYLSKDSWTVSVSSTVGLAVVVIPHIRIEGRFTNNSSLQNTLDVVANDGDVVNLSNIKTSTTIYSLGVDVDFFGDTAPVKPYIYLGGGYVDTERHYYASVPGSANSVPLSDMMQRSLSANLGAGLRIRIVNAIAFEIEAYSYASQDPSHNWLVNMYGTVGVRIFI